MKTQIIAQLWFQQPWWLGAKELLLPVTLVISLITVSIVVSTYRRNTLVRTQDVESSRVLHTKETMTAYITDPRAHLITATKRLAEASAVIADLGKEGMQGDTALQLLAEVAEEVDLVGLLHELDAFGYLLIHPEFVDSDEVLHTMASELRRLLLAPEMRLLINSTLERSTMRGIMRLRRQLRQYQYRFHQ